MKSDDSYKRYNTTNTSAEILPKKDPRVILETTVVYQNRIVAAANKVTLKPLKEGGEPIEILIVAPRHFDATMKKVYDALRDHVIDKGHDKQGFVDMHGNWHDRVAALAIAKSANQLLGKKQISEYELYSEDLYRNIT